MIALILIAIVLSIALGYVTRFNVGLFAIIFAYFLASFGMDMKPKALLSFWPISIFFVILAVSLFYNFASVNGTLEKLASHIIKRFSNLPFLLPFIIFLVSAIIAAMGAGFYSVLAFMAPIAFLLCEKTGLDKVGGAMAVNYGALGGANFPSSQSGIIFRGLMEKSGINADLAFSNSFLIFLASFLLPIVVISFFVLQAKKSGVKVDVVEKIEPYDKRQKMTLFLMVFMMFCVLIFPILHIIFPDSSQISYINSKINIGFIAIIFTVLALILKLGDEKKVIAGVPWATLIMICGVGLLIGVAKKAGLITLLEKYSKNKLALAYV